MPAAPSSGYSDLAQFVTNNRNATFDQMQWSETDSLIMAELSYVCWEQVDNTEAVSLIEDEAGCRVEKNKDSIQRDLKMTLQEAISRLNNSYFNTLSPQLQQLLRSVQFSKRYGQIQLNNYVDYPVSRLTSGTDDTTQIRQFSATIFSYQEGKQTHHHIAIRGTDGTLQGWEEDFNFPFDGCTESQKQAVHYLEEMAEKLDGPISLSGHSKGGNLCLYASLFVSEEIQNRLEGIYAFDAPGFKTSILCFEKEDGTVVYYRDLDQSTISRIQSLTHGIAPSNSVIGVLMDNVDFQFIETDKTYLLSHDPFSWKLDPVTGEFYYCQQEELSAKLENIFDRWVQTLPEDKAKIFTTTVFGWMYSIGAEDLDAVGARFSDHPLQTAANLIDYIESLPPDQRDIFYEDVETVLSLAKAEFLPTLPEEILLLLNMVYQGLEKCGIHSLRDFVLYCRNINADKLWELLKNVIFNEDSLHLILLVFSKAAAVIVLKKLLKTVLASLAEMIASFLVSASPFLLDILAAVAVAALLVFAGYYIYTHWEEIKEFFEKVGQGLVDMGKFILMIGQWLFEQMTMAAQWLCEQVASLCLYVYEQVSQFVASQLRNLKEKINSIVSFIYQQFTQTKNRIAQFFSWLFSQTITIDITELRDAVETVKAAASAVRRMDEDLQSLFYILNNTTMQPDLQEEQNTSFFHSVINYFSLRKADLLVDNGVRVQNCAERIEDVFLNLQAVENMSLSYSGGGGFR